jgi:hypothetical protein
MEGINEKDLLLTIWNKPKQTLKFILENCPKKYVTVLLILGGLANTFARFTYNGNPDNAPIVLILIIGIIVGGILGLLLFYLFAALLSRTGKWINGTAGYNKFITILAWSSVPSICTLIILILKLVVFGNQAFNIDVNTLNNSAAFAYYIFSFLEAFLSVNALVILIKGIALVQNFSIGKAILNFILPAIIIAIPILFIIAIGFLFHW